MTRRPMRRIAAFVMAAALSGALAPALAQQAPAGKKALVQRLLQIQQPEIETVTRSVVERPAMQQLQEFAVAMQQMVPPDKREAMAKQVEAEFKRYMDEAYPLARERALRIVPQTIGTILEEKFTEEELRQLLAWLESPVQRKFQQMGSEMRTSFIRKLAQEAQPVVDPKLQALDARLRAILGVTAPSGGASAPAEAGGAGTRPQPARPQPAARPASR